MPTGPDATKAERFAEFLRRPGASPPAAGFDEAYRQVSDILNAVEDEMTLIPHDPANWMNDGRMYPPRMDSLFPVPGHPDIRRFRSKGHNVLIGDGGAIEIRDLAGRSILAKPGADGLAI